MVERPRLSVRKTALYKRQLKEAVEIYGIAGSVNDLVGKPENEIARLFCTASKIFRPSPNVAFGQRLCDNPTLVIELVDHWDAVYGTSVGEAVLDFIYSRGELSKEPRD